MSRQPEHADPRISVVTPTLSRLTEVKELLENLTHQIFKPVEVILIDGAPIENKDTEMTVKALAPSLPFRCLYIRKSGGTAIQRNRGIEAASGDFIAFIDDDIRLAPDFFVRIVAVYVTDTHKRIGGIVGCRTNEYFALASRQRWRWYKRLRFFSTYEPGRYDYVSGYPINANMQHPFTGVREVDFMTTACAVWRANVFRDGLRFDPFFADYGILEDAHFSLRAKETWTLLQCGDARCEHLHASGGRENSRKIGYKSVVNYYYVFKSIAGPLSWRQQYRFWRVQIFELVRIAASAIRRQRKSDLKQLFGRIQGFYTVISHNV